MTKIAALMVTSVALVAGLTGCPSDTTESIGKDYFYGTWVTTDYQPTTTSENILASQVLDVDTLISKDSDEGFVHYYKGNTSDPYVVVVWQFDGKSESLFAKDDSGFGGGVFKQRMLVYDKAPTEEGAKLIKDNLALGGYKLLANSAYSRGKLLLHYEYLIIGKTALGESAFASKENRDALFAKFWGEYEDNGTKKDGGWTDKEIMGFALSGTNFSKDKDYKTYTVDSGEKEITDKEVNELLRFATGTPTGSFTLTHESTGSDLYQSKNGVWIYVKNKADEGKTELVCSDIEYFRFMLADEASSGYTRMKATVLNKDNKSFGKVYSQWIEKTEANTEKYGEYTKYGYPIFDGTSWSGDANTRSMGRYSIIKGEYLYNNGSKAQSNEDLFGKLEAEDTNDYTDPDSSVK